MVVNLYVAIQKILFNDAKILALLGIDPADNVKKAKRIQKRSDPQDLALTNLPLIAFYAVPAGGVENNSYVYDAIFIFDVYTNDNVSLAHDIVQRITDLFHAEMPPFQGVTSFESVLINQYESKSNLPNSYAFTTVINFSIALEK